MPLDVLRRYLRKLATRWGFQEVRKLSSRFCFVFRVSPPGNFGLPEEGLGIFRAGESVSISSDIVDSRTLQIVGHGTPSQYRGDDEALEVVSMHDTIRIEFRDNYVWIVVPGMEYEAALHEATSLVDRVLLSATVLEGEHFTRELLQATDETSQPGRPMPVPRGRIVFRGKAYDLARLTGRLSFALQAGPQVDGTLLKALEYFDHAKFLAGVQGTLDSPSSQDHRYLATDIFSNLYKAVSTILGDPTMDKDYQSRFREFGLTFDFWKERVERIRDLRNDYDVAHYDLTGRLDQLRQEIGDAEATVKEVLERALARAAGLEYRGLSSSAPAPTSASRQGDQE